MNAYEFTLIPNEQLFAGVHIDRVTRTVVQATGSNWVEALAKIDPEFKMYMESSKTLQGI